MLDPRHLEALEAIARNGTFLKASEELRISQPAISERIRLLEESLGRPILIRSTPIHLTQTGQQLISYFHQVKLLEDRFQNFDGGELKKWSRVPIAVNFDSLASWFVDAVSAEMTLNNIQLEILPANENRTLDLLKRGKALGCVSSDPNALAGCSVNYLGTLHYRCVASPRLFKRMKISPSKITAETLLQLPAIIYGEDDDFHESFLRDHYHVKSGRPPYSFVPFLGALKQALLAGWGYGLILDLEVANEIESHRLIDLAKGKSLGVRLYWYNVKLQDSILTSLSKSIIGHAKKALDQK